MQIEWQVASLSDWQADAIIFFSFEKQSEPLPGFRQWMATSGSWLTGSPALEDFQGKFQQATLLYAPPESRIPRVICIGLGPADKFEIDKLRGAAVTAFRKCRELELHRPSLPLSALEGLPVESAAALQEILVAGMAGLYRFDELKTRDQQPTGFPESLAVLIENEPGEDLQEAVSSARATVQGISLARDLVSAPGNQATPAFLLEHARRLSESYGFGLEVIDFETARELGMGAFTAVAQGSREPAYMIVLENAPPGTEQDQPLVFIGKGITFDTGGISIKPSEKMGAMKQDMAGAAAVLGAFKIFGEKKINRRVIGILPCTENMPDGLAYKPGDVIRSLSGLTIEVISTDAEGRMVLCDAISYSKKFNPKAIFDIATLTGACIIALGSQAAGIMGNRDDLVQRVREVGNKTGERLWPLPLWDSYFENIKSDVADFKNVGERAAGAIIGGLFLKQFVSDEIPWVHIDIAGTAWTDKDLGTSPKGATGFGVRLLAELAYGWEEL
jgi:leucyl aminopeptidase